MPTDELLDDPDMDRALRDLLPALPRSTAATAHQRDELLAFIETGVVAQHVASTRHDPGRTLDLVAERPVRPRRGRVLVGVAAAIAMLLAGLLVGPRWQGAERSVGTVPTPTTAPMMSPTTSPAPTGQLLLPDRFPIIPASHPLAGEATAMYGGMRFGDLSVAQALVAVDDGTTLAGAVMLMAYAQISDEMFPGAEPVTVAGIAGTLYTEHGTPEISTLVVPGPVPLAVQALDPIAFVEAAGGVPIVDARVEADGGVTFEVGALPDGYQVIVEPQQPVGESVSAMTRVPDGDNGDGNSVIVDRWDPLIAWAIVGDLERIDVNGIIGWKQDRGPGSTVIWQVSDLTWAMIGGATDVDAAVDLARAVEFTDRATWEERYAVELGTYPTREDVELGSTATTAPPGTAPDELDVLDDPSLSDLDRRACSVIGSSPSNVDRRVEIDCGSGDGLRVGMPVVNEAGLVGKLTTVALDTAVVMLVSDPQYSVMVSIAGEDGPVTGVLRGRGGDRLPEVSPPFDPGGASRSPSVGDAVTTAGGTDSNAPPGLPVGRVSAVDVSSRDPFVDVQPVTDVDPDEPLVVLLYLPPREAARGAVV